MPVSPNAPRLDGVPRYDDAYHELSFHGRLVKRFQRPAPWQIVILAAFEEQCWPEVIDDPLPGGNGIYVKGRLHDAVKGLNHSQKAKQIRFDTVNYGQGVRWEEVLDDT
ncbi:MAG: hypothetical protein U0746_08585 [Gemmataceae bacterium]